MSGYAALYQDFHSKDIEQAIDETQSLEAMMESLVWILITYLYWEKKIKHLMEFITQLYSRILSYMHWVHCTLMYFSEDSTLSFKPSGLSRMW